jgi:hypothetical protein
MSDSHRLNEGKMKLPGLKCEDIMAYTYAKDFHYTDSALEFCQHSLSNANVLNVVHHHHHHHQSFMELGHLLTRSGLTHPEVSLTVYHDFFCQLGNIVS